MTAPGHAPETLPRGPARLAWLPIPLFIVAVALTYPLRSGPVEESPVLLTTLNTLFCAAASLVAVYLAGRTYLASGSWAALFLGCGALAFGVTYLIAGALMDRVGVAVAFHNIGVFLAGACFLMSAGWALGQRPRQSTAARAKLRLALSYSCVLTVLVLVLWGAQTGVIPGFYVAGRGMTPLRQAVLWTGVVEFLTAALCLRLLYGRLRTPFILFYCIGLALIGVGLATVGLESAPGTPLSWVGRSGQYAGGIYMLIAVLSLVRASWEIPLQRNLRASEARYQSLVDLSPDATVVNADGRFLFANPAAARLFGVPSGEALVGRSVMDLVHPDFREMVAERMRRIIESRKATSPTEMVVLRLDGTPVSVEVTGAPVEYEGRPAAQAVVRDITERKRAEEALRASEARYRSLVEHSPSAIFVNRDNRIVLLNQAALQLFGAATPEEVLGKSPYDVFHPDYHTTLRERIRQLNEGQSVPLVEERIVRLDGDVRDVEVTAAPIVDAEGPAIQNILRDVTERRKREEELARLNRTLKALSDCSDATMRAMNEAEYLDETCRIIVEDCGHAMVWIGYAEHDEARSVRPVAYAGFEEGYLETLKITWADSERGQGPTGTAIRTGKVSRCRNMQTDPKFAPWRGEALKRGYASSIVLPLVSGGAAFGAINIYSRESDAFSEDETTLLSELACRVAYGISAIRLRAAHARAEEELRKAHDELEQRVRERTSELLERTSQLRTLALELTNAEQRERKRLAAALHDNLQQLLVGAKFGIQLVRQQDVPAETQATVEEVANLIDDSIKASRSLTAELSPPILHEAGLVAAIEWLGRWMSDKYGLKVAVDAGLDIAPDTEGVSVLLFQSVRELLFNVLKHAEVTAARVSVKAVEADCVRIMVADEGVGFDPALAREQGSEAGFGLFSITERIDLLGGRVEVDSSRGGGTRVTLVAPLARGLVREATTVSTARPPIDTSPAAAVAHGRKIRVLVADDHQIMRQGLVQLLKEEGAIEVVGEAADGVIAVEMAQRLHPDVVIMDVSMPRMNGIEATERIVSEMPEVRVIGLSMYEKADRGAAMFRAGAAAYLTKDGPSEDLIAAILAGRLDEEA